MAGASLGDDEQRYVVSRASPRNGLPSSLAAWAEAVGLARTNMTPRANVAVLNPLGTTINLNDEGLSQIVADIIMKARRDFKAEPEGLQMGTIGLRPRMSGQVNSKPPAPLV